MNKNIIIGGIIGAIIIGGGAFYAGTKYAGQSFAFGGRNGNFANLSTAEQQARFDQFRNGGGGARGGRGGAQGGGFVTGEILSKDNESITVKLQDGGSRIVFFSASTTISKSTESTSDDLKTGEQVVVTGSPNQDGSVNAQNIQLGNLPRAFSPPN